MFRIIDIFECPVHVIGESFTGIGPQIPIHIDFLEQVLIRFSGLLHHILRQIGHRGPGNRDAYLEQQIFFILKMVI